MRFRYSSVRAWIAGSLVFPIHATLIFMGFPSLCRDPCAIPPGLDFVPPLFPGTDVPGCHMSPLRGWSDGMFHFFAALGVVTQTLPLLSLFPTPEPRRRRSGSHPPRDSARSPPSPPHGSPAILPPEPVPASAGTELPRRRRSRKLPPRLPARSRANAESTPLPRGIPRRGAPLRESPRPRIEKDRTILQVEAWFHPHAGAQSSSWFANKVVPWGPRRQSRRELRAATRGVVLPVLAGHR